MLIEHNQKFQWKVCGQNVPLGFAELSAVLRDSTGRIVQELDTSHFAIDDYDEGIFTLLSDKLSPEASTFAIYGQLPNVNRVIITKGVLPAVLTRSFTMYAFSPRFPLDHALAFYRAISSGEYERGDLLMLVGAITGEIGAMLKANAISLSGDVATLVDALTYEECLERVATLENSTLDASDPNFDPGIWIPIIIRLIELWLSRRGS